MTMKNGVTHIDQSGAGQTCVSGSSGKSGRSWLDAPAFAGRRQRPRAGKRTSLLFTVLVPLWPTFPDVRWSVNTRRLRCTLAPLIAPLVEECLFNLVTDAHEPSFGLHRPIAKVRSRRFGFACSLFGRAQFGGELVGEIHGTGAIVLRHGGCSLQQRHDHPAGFVGFGRACGRFLGGRRGRDANSGAVGTSNTGEALVILSHVSAPLRLDKISDAGCALILHTSLAVGILKRLPALRRNGRIVHDQPIR
jgi:hypothetical protein